MTDQRSTLAARVSRGASASIGRMVVIHLLNGGATIVLMRLLTPSSFGIFAIVTTIAVTTHQFVVGGVTGALIAHQKKIDQRTIPTTFTLVCGILWLLATVAATITWLYPWSSTTRFLGCCVVIFLLITPLRFPAVAQCSLDIELGRLAVMDMGETAALQITAVIAVAVGLGVKSFGIALIASVLCATILAWTVGQRPHCPQFRWQLMREWARLARPFIFSVCLSTGRDAAAPPVLLISSGSAAVGFFGWASGLTNAVVGFVVVISNAFHLGVAKSTDRHNSARGLSIVLVSIALFAAGGLSAITAVRHSLLFTIFSPKWLPAMACMSIMAIAGWLISLNTVLLYTAYADGRARFANRAQIISLVFLIGGGLFLTHMDAQNGYAIALVGAMAVLLGLLGYSTIRAYELDRSASTIIPATIAAGVGAATIGQLTAHQCSSAWVALFVGLLSAMATFVVIITPISWRYLWAAQRELRTAIAAEAYETVTEAAPDAIASD
jgi:O-antigen/teichoic acid export membrane protein